MENALIMSLSKFKCCKYDTDLIRLASELSFCYYCVYNAF